jgi:hypothetical protein
MSLQYVCICVWCSLRYRTVRFAAIYHYNPSVYVSGVPYVIELCGLRPYVITFHLYMSGVPYVIERSLRPYVITIHLYMSGVPYVIELCGLRPYVITIRLYMCLVFLTL